MVPSTKHEGSSYPRRAAILAALVASMALLPGCNGRELERLLEALVLLAIVLVVVHLVVWGAMVFVIVKNLVHLGRGKPSLGWGATSIAMGAVTGLPAIVTGVETFHPTALGSLLLSGALCFLGYKNVAGARDLARWRKLGDDDNHEPS
ncbi:hypothetical protein [Polyangium jinanense]|uniref:Uncharacterized protein n=1 Tax=Polyangium jinanense TaxID=2829994 RepID=A0A9X4AQM1_9BACT|nr:hypothetical protein [Polyangium jinanense]MDC3953659.1 hypothetical protein [Polyangium jinanense]MDC3979220.1 hypothetical protein [Polyangium jinanense]